MLAYAELQNAFFFLYEKKNGFFMCYVGISNCTSLYQRLLIYGVVLTKLRNVSIKSLLRVAG